MSLDEYYFKDVVETKSGGTYEVAKFNHRRYPEVVYAIKRHHGQWTCSCQQGKMVCKHIKMVQEWLKNGKPSPFDRFYEPDEKI